MTEHAVPGDGAAADEGPLARRIRFALEADRLKGVLRRTRLVDGSRLENSAEHSWHVALLAVLLRVAAPAGVDHARVLRMLLVHDLVEVDAGDTFCYDAEANLGREARERSLGAGHRGGGCAVLHHPCSPSAFSSALRRSRRRAAAACSRRSSSVSSRSGGTGAGRPFSRSSAT